MENLNLLFYKTFYSKLGENKKDFEDDLKAKAKRMVTSKFYSENYETSKNAIAVQKFAMKTAYPGLIVGTGYAHGIDLECDIKVGFSFDYVTGQPYIPGSSVKGLLRSCFDHPEVIESLLVDKIPSDADKKEFIRLLKLDIFENGDEASDKTDIFFDAIVKHGNKEGFVLSFDYITPHGEDLTKNPTPIQILKILPDVVFEFAFDLKDSNINGHIIKAKDKKDLFESILKYFGIGAKTNVGYGILNPVTQEEEAEYVYPEKGNQTSHQKAKAPAVQFETANKSGKAEIGKFYDCTVTGIQDYGIFVRIDGLNKSALIHKNELSKNFDKTFISSIRINNKVIAEVIKIQPDGKIGMSLVSVK